MNEFGLVNGDIMAIGEGCWWKGGLGQTFMLVTIDSDLR